MISAVLFDLDGTLLDIDIDAFLQAYFGVLGPTIAEVVPGHDPREALSAVLAATQRMTEPHVGRTNREVFDEKFEALTGVNLNDASPAERIDRFYCETFPSLRGACVAREGAIQAVETARGLGLKVALATNPIFPRAAILERLSWTGISPDSFSAITTYENMHATKPHAGYFAEVAEMLGVAPEACLMVGDDAVLDLGAADAGMATYYVGPAGDNVVGQTGTLTELAEVLAREVL